MPRAFPREPPGGREGFLPGRVADTEEVLAFIARELIPGTYVNIMDQYRPCYKAAEFPPLNRRLTGDEFREALVIARKVGLWRLGGI